MIHLEREDSPSETGAGRLLAVALVVVLASAGAGFAAVAGSPPADQATRVRLTSHTLQVNWHAQTVDRGGQFLLLSGPDAASLEPVARFMVDPSGRYRLMDQVEFSGRLVYELRFVDSLGREQVLLTRSVSVEVIEGHPSGEIAPGFSLPIGLTAASELPPPTRSRAAHGEGRPAGTVRADAPPTPPPRRA